MITLATTIALNMYFEITLGFLGSAALLLRPHKGHFVVTLLGLLTLMGIPGSLNMLVHVHGQVPTWLWWVYLCIPAFIGLAILKALWLFYRFKKRAQSIKNLAAMWAQSTIGEEHPRPLEEAVFQIKLVVEKERHQVSERRVRWALRAAGYPNIRNGRRALKAMPRYDPFGNTRY
jgi:hypothetical protein